MKSFDIYELIEEIRPNVAMYIGDYSFIKFKSFLRVVNTWFTRLALSVPTPPSFHGLHQWVARRFLGHESAMGFGRIILAECGGDDKKALDMFFNLLDEYKSGVKPNYQANSGVKRRRGSKVAEL